jgi:hypothetical protein
MKGMVQFAKRERLSASHFTAIHTEAGNTVLKKF